MNAVGGKSSGGAWNAGGARNANGAKNVGGAKGSKKQKICYGCGQEGHFAEDKSYPARGKACRKCGKIGHFQIKVNLTLVQRHRDGGTKSDKGKSGTGRGGSRSGRDVGNEANSVKNRKIRILGQAQFYTKITPPNTLKINTKPTQSFSLLSLAQPQFPSIS